jgi:hypothetical protein
MFSVDAHFRNVLAWELSLVVVGAIVAVGAIVFLVRRIFPGSCCQNGTLAEIRRKREAHHGSIR